MFGDCFLSLPPQVRVVPTTVGLVSQERVAAPVSVQAESLLRRRGQGSSKLSESDAESSETGGSIVGPTSGSTSAYALHTRSQTREMRIARRSRWL